MRFSQLLRGVSPPVPPVGIGDVHRLRGDDKPEDKQVESDKEDARIVQTHKRILDAIASGAETYPEIVEKSGLSIQSVKKHTPDLAAAGKVKRIQPHRTQPVRFKPA